VDVYAIVQGGGTQQKVSVGDVISIDRVPAASGDSISLPLVMLVDGDSVTTDKDALAAASVTAEVVGPALGPKIRIQHYKNKTGYKRRQGHRQRHTRVKITDISSS
jgi:large subunit ribosomal protein L21